MLRCVVPTVIQVVRKAAVALKNDAQSAAEILPTGGNYICIGR